MPSPNPTPTMQPLKILMLHGYTQSGQLFRAKTRGLEKLLAKSLAPFLVAPELIYPTAPVRLSASEVPGFAPPTPADGLDPSSISSAATLGSDADGETESYAWFLRDAGNANATSYTFFDKGMRAVAAAIRDAGGVDAVVGFSQGGAVAAVVAAALEPGRKGGDGGGDEKPTWVSELREANSGRPLRFAVSYSGFYGRVASLDWCYDPPIRTPTLHFLGSLDTVVEESRSRGLVDRCEDPVVVVHPGGHHVPVAKQWAMPLVGFIRQHAHGGSGEGGTSS